MYERAILRDLMAHSNIVVNVKEAPYYIHSWPEIKDSAA